MKSNEENNEVSNNINEEEPGLIINKKFKNLVDELRTEQEKERIKREKFESYVPFIIAGGMLLVGVLFTKLYRSITE